MHYIKGSTLEIFFIERIIGLFKDNYLAGKYLCLFNTNVKVVLLKFFNIILIKIRNLYICKNHVFNFWKGSFD